MAQMPPFCKTFTAADTLVQQLPLSYSLRHEEDTHAHTHTHTDTPTHICAYTELQIQIPMCANIESYVLRLCVKYSLFFVHCVFLVACCVIFGKNGSTNIYQSVKLSWKYGSYNFSRSSVHLSAIALRPLLRKPLIKHFTQ